MKKLVSNLSSFLLYTFCAFFAFCGLSNLYAYDVNAKISNLLLIKNGEQISELKSAQNVVGISSDYAIADYFCGKLNEKNYCSSVLFSRGTSDKVQTLSDALKFASQEKNGCDFVLYGYIEENDACVNCEIKLVNTSSKKIEKIFYAKDDSSHFERLSEFICNNVYEYFCTDLLLGNGEELSENERKMRFRTAQIWMPVNVGSFVFLNDVWSERIIGIASFDASFDFKFNQAIFGNKAFGMDFFPRASIDFKYGLANPSFYSGNYFAPGLSIFECMSFNIKKLSSIVLGLGFSYECEILLANPKYDTPILLVENVISPAFLVECQFFVSEKWKVDAFANGNIPLGNKNVMESENPFFISFGIGFLYQIY